jgi:hypothetical protein
VRHVCLAIFLAHFFFVTAISCRETLWLIGNKLTIVQTGKGGFWRKTDADVAEIGRRVLSFTPLRQAWNTYLHLAGIETGYGYFAPNVPGSYSLTVELHYRDGHVEYELPAVMTSAAGLRVAGLLDRVGGDDYTPLRQTMIKMLAYSVWRHHPDVTTVRAILGSIQLPEVSQWERGERPSMEFIAAYDFALRSKDSDSSRGK